jgi:hypothetical protein
MAFTGVPACLFAELPKAVLTSKASAISRRSDYYRLERPLPGGNCTR